MSTSSLIPGHISPGTGLPALVYAGRPVVGQYVILPVDKPIPFREAYRAEVLRARFERANARICVWEQRLRDLVRRSRGRAESDS